MPSMFWPSLLAAAAAAFHAPAWSTAPTREQEPAICLTFKLNWWGTLDDVRRIAVEPVPGSYRRLYSWTGCQQLVKGSLIDWHLAFGDERSTTQALRFITVTALEGVPSTESFRTALPDTWLEAQKAVERHPIDLGASASERERQLGALRSDRAVRQLRSLVAAHERFALLAALYLRAAEFFRSQALLQEAATFLGPVEKAGTFFYEGQRVAKAAEGTALQTAAGIDTQGVNTLHDLQMRYALVQANISRSPADLAAAAQIVMENDDPVMRAAAEPLIDRGEDFCESTLASEMVRSSCGNETDLPGRLRFFWRSRAEVELASDVQPTRLGMPFPAFEVAWRAVDAAAKQAVPERVRYDAAADDHVVLLLAKAEAQFRRSQSPNISAQEATSLRQQSLGDLFRAERLTPPSLNPNRFKQIADLYITIFQSEPDDRRVGMIE